MNRHKLTVRRNKLETSLTFFETLSLRDFGKSSFHNYFNELLEKNQYDIQLFHLRCLMKDLCCCPTVASNTLVYILFTTVVVFVLYSL